MVFHVTVWYCMALYFVTFYCIVFCVIARCYMLLHWYCIILYCILWYCMVLQCIAWHQSIIYFWGKSPSYIVVQSHNFTMISSFVSLFYMGGNLLTIQSLILMSYFLYFWALFLATDRLAMPKIAIFPENVWAPHGLHASVWTISTFYIALFSEKCNRT